MIEKVVKYLQTQVESASIFQEVLGLTELIEVDGKTFPLMYSNNKYLMDFKPNRFFGVGYFRKNGNVGFSSGDFPDYKPCNVPVSVSIPLKFIGTILKSKLKCNDNYAGDNVAFYVAKKFEGINNIRTELNAKRVTYEVGEYSTDGNEILSQELSGIDKVFDPKYLYLSMDIVVEVQTTKGCMFDYCPSVLIDEVPNFVVDQNSNNILSV